MEKKSVYTGIFAGIILSGVYFIFLILIGGIDHAVGFISSLWYWLILIIVGFSLQIALYSYIRQKIKSREASAEITASAGISAGSMIACCLHLAVNLLPLVGVSALSIFLTAYQKPIILVGVFSNIIGVVFMLSIIKKHNLYSKNSKLKSLFRLNFKYLIIILAITSISTITATAFGEGTATTESTELKKIPIEKIVLEEKEFKINHVVFNVVPEIKLGEDIRFNISMNTHSVNLGFDMLKISTLLDSNGNVYSPIEWQGSNNGGHHRRGILIFPHLENNIINITLQLDPGEKYKNLNFKWNLK